MNKATPGLSTQATVTATVGQNISDVATLSGLVNPVSPFGEVSVADFRASGMTLVAGQRIHCSWFNIQEGPGLAEVDCRPVGGRAGLLPDPEDARAVPLELGPH